MKRDNFYVVCNIITAICLIMFVVSVIYIIKLELTLPRMNTSQIIVVIVAIITMVTGLIALIASMGEYKPDKGIIIRPYPIFTGDYDWAVSLREDCNSHWEIHYFYTKSVAMAFCIHYLQNKKWQNVILEYKRYVYNTQGHSLGWEPMEYPIEEYLSICSEEALKILRS